jgi:hypothetical protein
MARVAEEESVNAIHVVLAKLSFLRSISSSVGDHRPGRHVSEKPGRLQAPYYAIFPTPARSLLLLYASQARKMVQFPSRPKAGLQAKKATARSAYAGESTFQTVMANRTSAD